MKSQHLAQKIRLHALEMVHAGKSAHIGSVFSMTDILAVLYGSVLRKEPANPKWSERDRFILSKGHAGAGIYAALAESGFFPVEELKSHCKNGGRLSGHVSHHNVPGVEFSTGSLGHGLPVGAGMAFAAKLDQLRHRVYVLLSDGECDEGSNWESVLFAAHHQLSNLMVIVDYNKIQSLGDVKNILGLEPFAGKWRAFNWEVVEVDGHDHKSLNELLNFNPELSNGPKCILAHTIKGKGVSFMENQLLWHYRTPQGAEYEAAKKELESPIYEE
jgi:transketolase